LAGVVTLSQTERNLPTTANVAARDFKHLAGWSFVQIGPIPLNVTMPLKMPVVLTVTIIAGLIAGLMKRRRT
jgi:hypothetical protein